MIAIHIGLAGPAAEAGIEMPEDLENYNNDEYLRWHIFCTMQLGVSMPTPTVHWDNAKVIAAIPEEQLKTITPQELFDMGFQIDTSIP